jgi:hypothetical protein
MPKPIRIAQVEPPIPNNVGPECICVPKVYDWVVITEDINTTVPLPAEPPPDCPVNVTDVSCSLGSTSFFPVSCVGDGSCSVLDRRPANIDGVNAHIVKLRQQIPLTVTFTGIDAAGAPASCTIPVEASFIHQVILCFPDEFGDENLVCRIISGDCTITTPPPTGGGALPTSIGVELLLCIEIQVLASVKLEVLAKFCSPRPPVPITVPNVCPPLLFPDQCDFFPQPPCPCQATVHDTCSTLDGICLFLLNEEPVNGTQTLEAVICNYCSLSQSSISFRLISEVDLSQIFTFTANRFTVEELPCPICGPCSEFIVYGTGTAIRGEGTVVEEGEYLLWVGIGFYVLFLIFPNFVAYAENPLVPIDNLKFNQCRSHPSPLPI